MSARKTRAAAVIVAAGASGTDMVWAPVFGRPLLAWTLEAFLPVAAITRVVVVVAAARLAEAEVLVARADGTGSRCEVLIVAGGPRRRDSVSAGLAALSAGMNAGEALRVVVHDGARPLVTPELIATGLAAVERIGAATAIEPVKETIKRVRSGIAIATLPRERLARAQTPQVFTLETLLAAHAACDPALDPPDDAALALAAGLPVATFPGGPGNLKVTTREDLALVEALLRGRVGAPGVSTQAT